MSDKQELVDCEEDNHTSQDVSKENIAALECSINSAACCDDGLCGEEYYDDDDINPFLDDDDDDFNLFSTRDRLGRLAIELSPINLDFKEFSADKKDGTVAGELRRLLCQEKP